MNQNEENKNIYKKLREFRRARGLTATTLGEKIGEDPQKIGRIERGARNLTVDYLMKISKALETPLNVLLEDNTAEAKTSEPTPNILHEVVMLIEQHLALFPSLLNATQKAEAISKIYEITLKFPKEYQSRFLSSLTEALKLFIAPPL
jgi:transcriptional regulator with XRE-family HTH domain